VKKVVLYGVLNWGLGHATRSIPIIRSLMELDYEPIICSDGDALALLQTEFPDLACVTLPTYRIQYKYRSMVANVSRYGIGILKSIYQKMILDRGTKAPNNLTDIELPGNFDILDMADSQTLQQIISESRVVVSRAGYTTIMDLVAMQKPALLIPTPGQPEQEYLASHLATHFTGFRFLPQEDLDLSTALYPLPIWNTTEIEMNWSSKKLESLLARLADN